MKQRTTAIILSCLALALAMTGCGSSAVPSGGQCASDAECGSGAVCDNISTGECGNQQCVACSESSGPVCDAQGNTYANQCAALQAGKRLGLPCAPPGKVLCYGVPSVFCDPSTEVCVSGMETDCGGFSPAQCMRVDGGAGDGG